LISLIPRHDEHIHLAACAFNQCLDHINSLALDFAINGKIERR